ncbi:MAG: aquaporin Z [Rhodospirillales bacterium]|nr:aquaporin Z [Rhodospirillales bacterium]
MTNRLYAEFLGTAWLVLGGCGSAVLAAAFPQLGIGFAGVALAFGLTVVTMAYAVAPVSGAHFNPAITVGLAVGGRFPWREVGQYVVAQVLGGIAGAAILYVIATGRADAGIGSFATNGFGEHSPGGYGLLAAAVIEVVMTFGFVTVILGVTDKRAAAFAPAVPLAIGLTLTLIHLISIPVTNTSVNPARSTAPALFVGGAALAQLWLFWVAPLVGGAIAGLAYGLLGRKD